MRTFIGLLMFVFVVLPLVCGLFFLAAINSWAFDRGFYQEILDNPAVYEAMLEETSVEIQNTGTVMDDVPADAVGAGLREVLTPEYLRSQTMQVIDQVFDVLEGRTNRVKISVDLTPIKQSLSGESGTDFAAAAVQALPMCRAGENPRANAAEFPTCRAEGVSDEELIAQIEASLPALIEDMPDMLSIDESIDLRGPDNMPFYFPGITSIMATLLLSLAGMALIFWLANGVVFGDDRRSRLIALGAMLLIPAAFVLFAGLAMSGNLWESAIRSAVLRETGSPYASALADSAIDAVARVRTGFLVAGGIPFAISLALLAWGLASPSEKRKREDDGLYVTVPNRDI
jgi:hypothetical protein